MFTLCCVSVTIVIKALLYAVELSTDITSFFDLFFLTLTVPAIFVDIRRDQSISFALNPIITGLSFRIILLLWDLYGRSIFALPNSGNDSEMFYGMAVSYARNGSSAREGTFQNMMGRIFSFIGPSRLYGQFIIVLFSLVSLVLFARMLSKLDVPYYNKSFAIWLVALLPNYAILSSVFLRESVISMFITISFWYFVKWMRGDNIITVILAFVFAFTASSFHSGSAAVAIGYMAIILLYDRRNQVFRFRAKNLIPAVILLVIIAFLYINYGEELFGKMQDVNEISDIASGESRGNSSYARYVGDSSSLINMIIYTPLRIVFFLFSPFPWQWRGLSDIIAFVFSSMFFLYVAWSDIRFLRSKEKKNRTLVIALTIVAACTVFVFAWGVSNTGTACRHRDKITIIWGLLLAIVYSPNTASIKFKSIKS